MAGLKNPIGDPLTFWITVSYGISERLHAPKPSRLLRVLSQARNQDFMWGGANEAKVDQTTEMFFLCNFF